jgi:(1->4)-alpha-D-glucan 1-alpha-D-glucosylmutase
MKKEKLLIPRIPVSTYRLQFNASFTFNNAAKIVQYLYDLGISDMYSSPYLKASKESLHGYDVVDPHALNPEVGTEREYEELIAELKNRDMGQVLDIVPNHMCIASFENAWWTDVLENGPSSPYAHFFDIDWNPVKKELTNKVLLPFLGEQYGRVLENQELTVAFSEGSFFIHYYDFKFPVMPKTYTHILNHNIDTLRRALHKNNPYFAELLSIITALNHLPSYTESHPEKVQERRREKEIIKRRLRQLYGDCDEIRDFIDENVRTFNGIKGEPKSFDLLDNLLREQIYRFSHWRVAGEEINYKRFFDINSLGALHMQKEDVFRETHKLIFDLIGEGKVTGLRVDHPDGLYNPSEYFHRLQKECFVQLRRAYIEKVKKEARLPADYLNSEADGEIAGRYREMLDADPGYKPFYIIGEKILTKGEIMPEEWPIFSTTGYVFLNSVNGIFVDTNNGKTFDRIYRRFAKTNASFQDTMYEKKKLVMQVAMSGEVNVLGHYLNRLSEKNRHTRDFTLNSLIKALIEIIAYFPVYRTYITTWKINERDSHYIDLAVSKAKKRNPALNQSIFDFIRDVLLLRFPDDFNEDDKSEWLDFTMRFQQITGPVTAKGVEDTAFYIYNRLTSLNEVGGSPDRFGTLLKTFHGQNIERIKSWPHALITTSTHDCKRSEDVRARINVLSELPDIWNGCLTKWARYNVKKKIVVDNRPVPDQNEEYLLYQTLLGVWPIGEPIDAEEYAVFTQRIKDYMQKASREAKEHTSWINPDAVYEDAMNVFIDVVMTDSGDNEFLGDFLVFQRMVSDYGIYNSLSQTLLKITSPGVADFYQGTELWNFALVDPDNRRPVDYRKRIGILESLKGYEKDGDAAALARRITDSRHDGMIKMYLIYKALHYRRQNRYLFETGRYIPLITDGGRWENICSFARKKADAIAITVAPRFFSRIIPRHTDLPLGRAVWGDTFVAVPFEKEGAEYRNIFTDEIVQVRNHEQSNVLYIGETLANYPVALLDKVR